jgi:hypothetical protein
MDRRAHHRVQLRLPARLRWTTPFGQRTEVCETVNVSRGGLLVPCEDAHALGMSVWVTFPYDAATAYGQPEILAQVVRAAVGARRAVGGENENGPAAVRDRSNEERSQVAALRFSMASRRHANGNGHGRDVERRLSPREPLAVPVRVRPEHVPWFEETMTVDCSTQGLKFCSNREYSPGEYLVISFESVDTSPWPGTAEMILMVARIEREPQSPALHVAVCRSQQFNFRF